MANRRLMTLLGSPIISKDVAVVQSDKVPIGAMVKLLIIEFDKEKYEEFLSSGSISLKSLRKYWKVSTNLASKEALKIQSRLRTF